MPTRRKADAEEEPINRDVHTNGENQPQTPCILVLASCLRMHAQLSDGEHEGDTHGKPDDSGNGCMCADDNR